MTYDGRNGSSQAANHWSVRFEPPCCVVPGEPVPVPVGVSGGVAGLPRVAGGVPGLPAGFSGDGGTGEVPGESTPVG